MEDLMKKMHILSGPTLFRDEDGLVTICKDFLIEKGYGIREPLRELKHIKKLDDLIDFFYTLLLPNHPDIDLSPRNNVRDRQIAKEFIKARQDVSNISRAQAIRECVAIMTAVVKYEKEFYFNRIPDFSIFGQDKLGWVTQKAIGIINKEKEIEKEKWRFETVCKAEEEAYVKLGGPAFTDEEVDDLLKEIQEN